MALSAEAENLRKRNGLAMHKYKVYMGYTTDYLREYYLHKKNPTAELKPQEIDLNLPSIYSLARYLNSYLGTFPYRKVHAVLSMSDDRPAQTVKFLPDEYKSSHFYETAEERLQAVLELTVPCDTCVELEGFNSPIFYSRGILNPSEETRLPVRKTIM